MLQGSHRARRLDTTKESRKSTTYSEHSPKGDKMSTYPILFPSDDLELGDEVPIVFRVRGRIGYTADADPRDADRGAAEGRRAAGSRWSEWGAVAGIDDLEDQLIDQGWSPDPGPAWVTVRG